MLKCWNKEPMERPTFMTIHTDFIDFDSTCDQYDYLPSIYMVNNGLTNVATLPRNLPQKNRQRTGTPRTARARR